MRSIDKWVLARLYELTEKVTKAYDDYQFHVVFHSVHNFCAVDMSALYLDVIKDRLYCDGKDSVSRRAAQTVLYEVTRTLLPFLAPIIPTPLTRSTDICLEIGRERVPCRLGGT